MKAVALITPLMLTIFLLMTAPLHAEAVAISDDVGATTLTDPTRPNWFVAKNKKARTRKRAKLNSLVTGEQRRIAVINGVMMREGESKNGLTLEAVFEDRVLVSDLGGKKQTLRLDKASRKSITKRSYGTIADEGTKR